ncbi:MAG TPA: hypothetical protein VE685_16960 [Thermoanaerobaculia bacterium]|nr:hypothetical protein [Thermoanaerobaculia bacterium]
MFFDGFILRLRESGIPVSMTEALDFYQGLEKGLAPDLDSLFLFARLCFVRRVEHMDAYERAFAFHFYGIDLPRVAEGDPELLNTPQFREWLKEAIRKKELPPQALWTISPEELMKRFWETVREQAKAHHGGSRWVGTGGNSPFGHSGNAKGGVRVFGPGGGRSALKVIGERRYVDYSDETALHGSNLSQALAALKKLVPAGPRDQLDLDATIQQSAKNGGEIDLVFRRDLLDRIEVVLLIDNGGASMLPYVHLTRLLFSKVRDRIKRLTTLFFHNTIYGAVYKDARRLVKLPTEELLKRNPETRLLVLGDASMAPDELLYPRGALYYYDADDEEPSVAWLRRLRDRFRHSVWLNPIPKENWESAYGRFTIQKIGELFPMEDLTLGGIKRAVERLNRG